MKLKLFLFAIILILGINIVHSQLSIVGNNVSGVIDLFPSIPLTDGGNASFNASACGGNFGCLNNIQTFTGNNTFNALIQTNDVNLTRGYNISLSKTSSRICLSQNCLSYIYHDGSNIIIYNGG